MSAVPGEKLRGMCVILVRERLHPRTSGLPSRDPRSEGTESLAPERMPRHVGTIDRQPAATGREGQGLQGWQGVGPSWPLAPAAGNPNRAHKSSTWIVTL
jgi:hypothetical protein